MRLRSRLGPAIAAAFLLAIACRKPEPSRKLTRLEVFRCSQAKMGSCQYTPRGRSIGRDSLPPADESFQAWAWYTGKGTVLYQLRWQSRFFADSGAPVAARQAESVLKDQSDSSMIAYNFSTATRTRYVLHVLLAAPDGKIEDQDSLVWDFTGLAGTGTPVPPHVHAP